MRLLAFFSLMDASALSGYMTRSETVKTQVIQPQSRHHLSCLWADGTQVLWMFLNMQIVQLIFAPAVKETYWCSCLHEQDHCSESSFDELDLGSMSL